MLTFHSCDFSEFESLSGVKPQQSCLITELGLSLSNRKLHFSHQFFFFSGSVSRGLLSRSYPSGGLAPGVFCAILKLLRKLSGQLLVTKMGTGDSFNKSSSRISKRVAWVGVSSG